MSDDRLSALFLNCTLKPSGQTSHTERLMRVSEQVMRSNGVSTHMLRPVDLTLPPGIYPDMREHGFEQDDWPELHQQVLGADILVIGTPIWLGQHSSVCSLAIERLYGYSGKLNDKGQYAYYGRAGGCLVTGNEDGIKHVSMGVLYSLQHLGYTIPPQADAGWIGAVGPGPSYGDVPDDGGTPAGFDSNFTNRNTTFMTWNLLHTARMLTDAGGVPAYGNQQPKWADGERFGFPENPEYR